MGKHRTTRAFGRPRRRRVESLRRLLLLPRVVASASAHVWNVDRPFGWCERSTEYAAGRSAERLASLLAVVAFYVGKKIYYDIRYPDSGYGMNTDDLVLYGLLAVVAGVRLRHPRLVRGSQRVASCRGDCRDRRPPDR